MLFVILSMDKEELAQFHPRVAALLADLYGIERLQLTRQEVRIKYRLTYERLDYVVARALRQLEYQRALSI